MELEYKKMLKALVEVEAERSVKEEVILEALKEGMVKAYKKDSGLDDITVTAQINEKKKTIDLYQEYTIVAEDDDIQDDELEISLEEAKKIDRNAVVGGTVKRLIVIDSLSRAAVSIAKNVIRQQIKEAQKKAVYNAYIDLKGDMILGVVETVKEKFALVNLGKTVAVLPKSQQIPGEHIYEGQQLRVIIADVNEESKGSQVTVSRKSELLVKRLFEKEVPEIYNGIVEIKAIARDAGERTKMAVSSRNKDIDPIGACIGQRGQRVQEIINELNGEKIDIFQYSSDYTELVKNALAPAEVLAVLPDEEEENKLLVIVNDNQLSLAIGKKGKNAHLAVSLTGYKIDIKTRKNLEEAGYDYDALIEKAADLKRELQAEAAQVDAERKIAEAKVAEEKMLEKRAELMQRNPEAVAEEDGFIPEEMMETISDNIRTEIDMKPEDAEETTEEAGNEEQSVEETAVPSVETEEEPVEEVAMEKAEPSRKHADLEEMAANNTYVSRFEKLADTSKGKQETKGKKKFGKKKTDDDNYKLSNKELQKQLNAKLLNQSSNKPVYSDEELAEIEAQQEAEAAKEYDFDYDEYEDYYDDDED